MYRVSPPRPPRILNAEMFSSPPKPFDLPSYAGGLALVFAEAPSRVPVRTRHYNSRVLVLLMLRPNKVTRVMVALAVVFDWP